MSFDLDQVTQIPPKTEEESEFAFTKEEIVEYAKEKLEEYGLEDWDFEFNFRFKRKIGRCKCGDKTIELSGVWFIEIGMDRIVEAGGRKDFAEDTILHEIAHALDFLDRGKSGHDWRWKEMARKVGADPTRTESIPDEIVKLKADWYRECPNCGEKYYYHKKPTAERACGKCCDEHNHGNFDERFIMEVKKNDLAI